MAAGLLAADKKKENKEVTVIDDNYFDAAVKLYNLGNYKLAIEYFTKVIDKDSGHCESFLYRATCNYILNNYEKAHEDVDVAIRYNYRLEWAYNIKGNIYRYQGQPDKAVEYYDKGIALDKYYSYYYINKADALYNLEKYREAIETVNKSPEKNETGEEFKIRAKCYYMLTDYPNAINEITQYININPKEKSGYEYRGDYHKYNNEYAKALADYKKCLRLSPDDPDIYNSIGQLYDDLNEYAKAINYYDKAIKIKNDYYYYYYCKAISLYYMNKFSECEKNIDKSLELDKTYFPPLLYKGYISETRREFNKTIETDKMILSYDYNYKSALEQMARVYIELRNMDEAQKVLEQLFNLDKNNRGYYINSASINNLKKEYDKAKEQYLTLLSINSKSNYTYSYLADISIRLKDFKASDEYYKKSLDLDNKYFALHINRSIYDYEVKSINDSLTDIKNAINCDKYNVYSCLIYLFYSSLHSEGEVKKAVKLLDKNKNNWTEIEWQNDLVNYMLTDMSDEKLFTRAGSISQNLCEAYFYAGTKSLMKKDKIKALEYFKKCIETDAVNFFEYQLAEVYLQKNPQL